jgi:hypothetical protein
MLHEEVPLTEGQFRPQGMIWIPLRLFRLLVSLQ